MWRRFIRLSRLGMAVMTCLAWNPPVRGADTNGLELLTEDLGVSLWDESFSLRTGMGYKDNVLLSSGETGTNGVSGVKSSPYFTSGLDATIFRLPLGDWEYYFFLTGDDIRYWRNIGVGSEDLWLAAAKIQRDFGGIWKAGWLCSYTYEAQVFDIADLESADVFEPAKIIGHTITVRPSLRAELGKNWWLELELDAIRQFFSAPAYSYWSLGPKITLGRAYGNQSELSLSYDAASQFYDNEPQAALDADGNGEDIAGTHLNVLKHRVELAWHHHWDQGRHWQTTTKLNFDYAQDNGTGFYDYFKYGISGEIGYKKAAWEVKARASAVRYEYPNQDAGTDPFTLEDNFAKWRQTTLVFNVHGERYLTKYLKLFAEYNFEQSISTRPTEQYRVNTISAGLGWEFYSGVTF